MRRLLLIPVALLLGLASAVAFASNHSSDPAASGKIASLSASSITVSGPHHRHLSCAITSYSPATNAFQRGDRVRITCQGGVLIAIESIPVRRSNTQNEDAWTTGISGTVTALDSSSITVHDGDRDLTCAIGSGSPSTSGFALGDHVAIGCANGELDAIGDAGSHATTTTTATPNAGADGPISALGASSISVEGLSCTFGSGSPLTAGFELGDQVRMYCLNGVLYALYKIDATPPATTAQTLTAATTTTSNVTDADGPIGALSSGSITVGDLTCTIGGSSPSTSGFSLGTQVRMYCINGVLYRLYLNETTSTTTTTTPTTTTTSNVTDADGPIGALSSGSITVGDLTCTIGGSSPSTSGFSLGTQVRMYCINGALYRLYLNETTTTTTTTTGTTTAATTTTSDVTDADGPISALSADSITVGELTCTITNSSPSTTGFTTGTQVRMYCINGVLYQLRLNESSTTTTTTTTTTTAPTTTSSDITGTDGTIGALSSSSITVGDLTCTIGGSSPSTSGFTVGNDVELYCKSGALYALIHA